MRGDRQLEAAYAEGMRAWRQTYGTRLAQKALRDARSVRKLPSVARNAGTLLRYDPGIVGRGMRKAVSQRA